MTIIESDHSSMIGTFNINVQTIKPKEAANEIFNFKDPEAQSVLQEMTSSNTLSRIFENSNVVEPMKKWHKEFQNIRHRSFLKIRIKLPNPLVKK